MKNVKTVIWKWRSFLKLSGFHQIILILRLHYQVICFRGKTSLIIFHMFLCKKSPNLSIRTLLLLNSEYLSVKYNFALIQVFYMCVCIHTLRYIIFIRQNLAFDQGSDHKILDSCYRSLCTKLFSLVFASICLFYFSENNLILLWFSFHFESSEFSSM